MIGWLTVRSGPRINQYFGAFLDTSPISAGLHGECTEQSWPVQEPFETNRLAGTPTDTQSAGRLEQGKRDQREGA
jgi:hypothetical protein